MFLFNPNSAIWVIKIYVTTKASSSRMGIKWFFSGGDFQHQYNEIMYISLFQASLPTDMNK